jgi:hypothetical protein
MIKEQTRKLNLIGRKSMAKWANIKTKVNNELKKHDKIDHFAIGVYSYKGLVLIKPALGGLSKKNSYNKKIDFLLYESYR